MSDSVAAAKLAEFSNVYYLPAPEAVLATEFVPSRWARLTRTWWRVRFALAGIRLALRPAPTQLFVEDDPLAVLHGDAELVDRRPRPSKPARVIDFDPARVRLRP